ncbi:MAG: hypothetical protein J7L71_02855 [Spirochaetaceae bacterium]|nr:hypothetical protein [Spirochaetaceae bacterium]
MEKKGAWVTDIDDTLIESGATPPDVWIEWLSEKIRILNAQGLLWVPMSGVAITKLGPRILYRLPADLLPNVVYYAGDGSQKYYYDTDEKKWIEDISFQEVFTELQTIAVLGQTEFKKAAWEIYNSDIVNSYELERRVNRQKKRLVNSGFDPEKGILDILIEELEENGFDPGLSEIYYRGGSISWLILGDISSDPYKDPKVKHTRNKLIELAKKLLRERENLKALGDTEVVIPFPGARGIKFVLKGNTKERSIKDFIEDYSFEKESILFVGNELFKDGNDNMIRNINKITLLSVGEHTDPGEYIVEGGLGQDANRKWMDSICELLKSGYAWRDILKEMRIKGYLLIQTN